MSNGEMLPGVVRTLKIGEIAVGKSEGVLTSVGVGSCVIIILYHAPTKIGGLAHILLPSKEYASTRTNPYRFPDEAVAELRCQMEALGAKPDEICGKIVGGATLFSQLGKRSIGNLNVSAAKAALKKMSINLVAEDTLGNQGRSVYFNLNDGTVKIRILGGGEKII